MLMKYKNKVFVIISSLIIFSLSYTVFASYKSQYPYYNFTFGARALSMGNAFTAVSSDLSSVYNNPSGLATFKTPKIYLSYGLSDVRNTYDTDIKDYGSYKDSYTDVLNIDLKGIDFFSVSAPATFLGTNWYFALSYYRLLPYNYNGKHETNLSRSNDNSYSTKTSENIIGKNGIEVVSLSAAFSISDYLFFGATVQQFLNTGNIKYTYSSESLDYSKEFTENIRGRSYIFGILFAASEDVSIGFSYNTKFTETFNTKYTYTEDIESNNTESIKEATLAFPASFSIGISARLLPEWLLSYNYKKILWSKSTVTDYHNSSTALPFPVRDDFSFTQTDITNSNFGTEINIPLNTNILFIRGGLSTAKQLFADYEGTQVKLKGYSCGLGYSFKNKFIVDLAFMYKRGKWKEKAYFQSTDSSTTNTVYSNFKEILFKISLTYNF